MHACKYRSCCRRLTRPRRRARNHDHLQVPELDAVCELGSLFRWVLKDNTKLFQLSCRLKNAIEPRDHTHMLKRHIRYAVNLWIGLLSNGGGGGDTMVVAAGVAGDSVSGGLFTFGLDLWPLYYPCAQPHLTTSCACPRAPCMVPVCTPATVAAAAASRARRWYAGFASKT